VLYDILLGLPNVLLLRSVFPKDPRPSLDLAAGAVVIAIELFVFNNLKQIRF
jgi:hypothetical protein